MNASVVAACEAAARLELSCRETFDGTTVCGRDDDAPGTLHLINAAISGALSVSGLLLNGLLAYTICSEVRFHTPVNAVVVALTATNVLLLVGMVPFSVDNLAGWFRLCAAESMAFLVAKETVLTCFTAVAVLRFLQVVLGVAPPAHVRSLLMTSAAPLLAAYALVAAIWTREPYKCQPLALDDRLGRAILCWKPPNVANIMPLLIGSDVIGIVITGFCYGAVLWKVLRRSRSRCSLDFLSSPFHRGNRQAQTDTSAARSSVGISPPTPTPSASPGGGASSEEGPTPAAEVKSSASGDSAESPENRPAEEGSVSFSRSAWPPLSSIRHNIWATSLSNIEELNETSTNTHAELQPEVGTPKAGGVTIAKSSLLAPPPPHYPHLLHVPPSVVPPPLPTGRSVTSTATSRVSPHAATPVPPPGGRRAPSRVDVVTWMSSCSHLAAMVLGLAGPALVGLSLDQHPHPFLTSGEMDWVLFGVLTTSSGITHMLPSVLVIFCSSLRSAIAKNLRRLREAVFGR